MPKIHIYKSQKIINLILSISRNNHELPELIDSILVLGLRVSSLLKKYKITMEFSDELIQRRNELQKDQIRKKSELAMEMVTDS